MQKHEDDYRDVNMEVFDRSEPHTLIVLGPPRSGTSMVAGILRILGVYMGQCSDKNNEDPRFNSKNSLTDIRDLINANNVEHPHQWGWKEPSTHQYFEDVADCVRTPVFLIVYRNILDSIGSRIKHAGPIDVSRLSASYANQYLRISRLVNNTTAPRIFISYEQALKDPLQLAAKFSERFLGQPIDASLASVITDYCAPGSYKSAKDFRL